MRIRLATSTDIACFAEIADATALFPGGMLPDMMGAFLADKASRDIWLAYESEGKTIGFCFAVPEQLTEGTWNMLALAVHPGQQGKGAGSALVCGLEAILLNRGQRVLIADTSGNPEFERTRRFYLRNGYHEEARIRDFWAPGNDKVVFWKQLTARAKPY